MNTSRQRKPSFQVRVDYDFMGLDRYTILTVYASDTESAILTAMEIFSSRNAGVLVPAGASVVRED